MAKWIWIEIKEASVIPVLVLKTPNSKPNFSKQDIKLVFDPVDLHKCKVQRNETEFYKKTRIKNYEIFPKEVYSCLWA